MNDNEFMLLAIEEAKKSFENNEVPVGAVIVKDGEVIARAHNTREQEKNVFSHAEVLVIKEACEKLNRWILDDCTIYITCEPCLMCAGAIQQSRIKNIVYGVSSPKYGVHESTTDIFNNSKLFHNIKITTGVCSDIIEEMMKDFFKKLR